MKIFPQYVMAIFCCVLSYSCFSQTGKAKIYKNRNTQVAGFYHDFNQTKDTLIIKSDKKISYLYTANNSNSNDLTIRVDSNSYKLPLSKLNKGRNVLVAIQSPLKIVFVVEVEEVYSDNGADKLIAVD